MSLITIMNLSILFSVVLVFISHILQLFCFIYTQLVFLYLLDVLNFLSLYHVLTLVIFFAQKSAISDINVAKPALF